MNLQLMFRSVARVIAEFSVAHGVRTSAGVGLALLLSACVAVAPSSRTPVERQGEAPVVPAPVAPQPVAPVPAAVPDATPPHTPAATVPPPNAPVGAVPRGAGTLAAMSLASQALLAQSRQQAAAGNLGAAADELERALRIDPAQPLLWLELGEVRLAAGDRGQAQIMAHKAQSLGARDPAIQARAGDLLARAGR